MSTFILETAAMVEEPTARDRHFARRLNAAKAGLHLPSAEDLLRGMNFFRDERAEDMREYANRLSRHLRKRNRESLASLIGILDEMAVYPDEEGLGALEGFLEGMTSDRKGFPADECRLRCRYYKASFGDARAAAIIAGETAKLALEDIRREQKPDLIWRALSWAVHATYLQTWKDAGIAVNGSSAQVQNELRSFEWQFKAASQTLGKDENAEGAPEARFPPADSTGDRTAAAAWDAAKPDAIIVVRSIGNDATSEGKRVAREFDSLIDRPLALKTVPDLAGIHSGLLEEFPYAASVVEEVLKGLVGRRHVWVRPTVLLGAPGCGKTRFTRLLAEALQTPYELVSCGGISDSAIGGTPRRWSTGEPSLPIMSIRRHECAGPIIILDEIEKTGSSRHNGNAHDVLVGLLEAETSRRWHDPYVESSCDLSHVSWLMTANSVDPIPAFLRDRCRIIPFPEPGPEQLAVLAPRILARLYVAAGHDPRWATPLQEYELDALSSVWRGGSIRKLERLVEVLIQAREQGRLPQ